MVRKAGHPLGVTGRMLLGVAITSVGVGLGSGVAAAEPSDPVAPAAEESRPALNVRTMTDQELGTELGRVYGKDSLRAREVVTEMRARGMPMFEAAPPASGFGISGGIPVRPGVSVTGTLAYDPQSGSWITSGGVRVGTPTGPQFTGIAPRPDGFNASGNVKVDLGEHGEFSSTLSLNVSPDLEVSGSYKAKGTVTTPDGRSYETEVTVSRNADGTVDLSLPDGFTTSTELPGGGTIDTTTPADPFEEDVTPPEVKGPAPKTEEKPEEKGWFDWFDWSGALSFDKEFRPSPLPMPTPEELEQAKKSWAEQQQAAQEEQNAWRAQNRPEAQYREALEIAAQEAAAAEQNRRNALPDRDRDGLPDEEDATWNQNDTDPTSSDIGDGPEGGAGYPSDRVENPAPTSPPESDDPNADFDRDGRPDNQDATWNQNDTDPSSSDIGDGPESGEDHSGNSDHAPTGPDSSDAPDSGGFAGDLSDADGDGRTGADDATPNQNDTDPASTDIGDGPEGGEGYGSGGGSDDAGATSDGVGYSGGGGEAESEAGADTGGDTGSGTSGYSGGGEADANTGGDAGGYSGGEAESDTGSETGGYSDTSTSDTSADTGGYSGDDADGDGLSGAADSTPNQNDTDPASADVGDGPEGNAGYGGSTDSESTGDSDSYGSDPGSCTCF